jgi:8-oxo-dGTP pyrophosphatase MutT (NUDIX family)
MRERPSSRLLVIDPSKRVLLFRFEHKKGALAGQNFWATPGGALDPGESYEQDACRELLEETGLSVDDPGPMVNQRIVTSRCLKARWYAPMSVFSSSERTRHERS